MEYIILTLILAVNFITLGCLVYSGLKFYRLYLMVVDFIMPVDEKSPSKLALAGQALSDIFARSITAQLKATFMGIQSGENRAIKSLEGDIAEDMLGQSGIGSLLKSFPALRKTLRRNPQLLDWALGLLQSKLKTDHNSGLVNSSSNQTKFNL